MLNNLAIKRKNWSELQKKCTNKRKALLKEAEVSAGAAPAVTSSDGSTAPVSRRRRTARDTLLTAGQQKKSPEVSSHGSSCYVQVVESLLKVSTTDSSYMKTGNTAAKLGKLMDIAGWETVGLPKGKAVPLFLDTFLSGRGMHGMCFKAKSLEGSQPLTLCRHIHFQNSVNSSDTDPWQSSADSQHPWEVKTAASRTEDRPTVGLQ